MTEVKYKDGYGYIDGYKFRKDKQSGYYLSTKKINGSRKRLHIYVWEKHNGSIPKGFEINHIDENKDNNEIENLQCLTRAEHLQFHKRHDREKMLSIWRNNIEKARPAAIKWHKSPEGRKMKSKLFKGKKFSKKLIKRCKHCGKVYRAATERSLYCSRKCVSAYRRKQGLDDEKRTCVVCGKLYIAGKYSEKTTCSKDCRSKLRLLKNKKNRGTTKLPSGKYIGQVGYKGRKYHTGVFETEEEAHNARNLLIDSLIR